MTSPSAIAMDESNITIDWALLGVGSEERGEPCQLMQRVRLQTSSSASNSRARATEGNLAASWVSDNPGILREQMAGL